MAINWEVILWTCITLAVLMGVIGLILYAISAKNVRSKRKELGEVHTGLNKLCMSDWNWNCIDDYQKSVAGIVLLTLGTFLMTMI